MDYKAEAFAKVASYQEVFPKREPEAIRFRNAEGLWNWVAVEVRKEGLFVLNRANGPEEVAMVISWQALNLACEEVVVKVETKSTRCPCVSCKSARRERGEND